MWCSLNRVNRFRDAIVLSGEVRVNESLLTGESDEITKVADSQLLSGSFIVSGSCYARIDKIGAEAYVHQLTLEAKSIKKGTIRDGRFH